MKLVGVYSTTNWLIDSYYHGHGSQATDQSTRL